MGADKQLRLSSTKKLGSGRGRVASNHEGGRSIQAGACPKFIEFLIVLPFLIGLTIILNKADTAIQVFVVEQEFPRGPGVFLAQNSPVYPRLKMLSDKM